MQKKVVYAIILLGFGISMELVLALHFMNNPGSFKNLVDAFSKKQAVALVPTIAINYNSQPNLAAEPDQDDLGETPAAPDQALTPEAYPAPDNGQPEDVAPADSESPTEAAPLDDGSGAPPDVNSSQPENGYPPPDQGSGAPPDTYSPPDDQGGGHGDYPTDETGGDPGYPPPDVGGAEPTTPAGPTATQAAPTAAPATSQPTAPATAQPTAPAPTANPTAVLTPTKTKRPPAASPTATPPVPDSNPPENTASPAPPPANTAPAAPFSGLVSVPASDRPKLDGVGSDPAWENAPAVVIDVSGGANQSATQVTVRSVYDGKNIFFLLTWRDPSQSFLLNPWEKQPDGSWKILTGPDNQGGDENQFYMDKLALLWPIQNSLPDFSTNGCGGLCHTGEHSKVKPYGLMYTAGDGQMADLWQWKSVKNVGQADDDYLDNAHYSKDTFWAGLKADPGKDGYSTNQTDNRKAPAYMPPGGGDRSGAPGFILDAEKTALDDALFQPGDRVPSVITAPFGGDRGDISAGWRYADGAWTLELGRKLVTGSPYDIQFDDLGKTYAFALAVFDNSQIRHALQSGATQLKFQR